MNKKSKNIYLIDGTSLCYRAFYAIQQLSTSKGMPTNAIYGFVNMFNKLIKDNQPDMLAVVFDLAAPTVRHEKYEEYKIHRKPTPEELIDQIPRIKELVKAYNVPVCELEGYEADDIIATLAEKAKKKGLDVTIVTSDKDALQLVDGKVKVLSPHTSGEKVYDADKVKEKYGVDPGGMVEFMALTGDTSDNIPGVKGIGKVTAAKLIKQYGTVDDIYTNLEEVSSKSVKRKLEQGREMAQLSRELVELDREVPIEFDFGEAELGEPNAERLEELFREFEFEKLLRQISPREAVEGKYSTVDAEKKVRELFSGISGKKRVSFSLLRGGEGGALHGLAASSREGESFFIPFSHNKGRVFGAVKEILEDETIQKIGYDLKEDLLILRQNGIKMRGMSFDVMLAEYLSEPSRPNYALRAMAERHLGYDLSRGEGKFDDTGQATLDLAGEAGSRLCCEQSDIIYRLFKILDPVLRKKKLNSLFNEVEMPLIKVLADMEQTGVAIDVEYLKQRSKALGKKLDELTSRIHELAGEKFNINSPKQLQVILYEKLSLPVIKRTKTGASTDEGVLRRLAKQHELPAELLEYRELNKLKTAYYDSILGLVDKKTHRLHARFNQAVTATGRLSSSEPNLQNIPIKTVMGKEIRRAFKPSRGKLLLAADYSQVELRILAHLSGDKNLIKAFSREEDVHRYTASLIFDCSASDVTGKMRAVAKTVNFGIVYGMSPFGLAKDLGIRLDEAERFIDSYFSRYSGVKKFIDSTISDAGEKGYVTTLLNRRRYIPEINSDNDRVRGFAERTAVNTPVQGSAADLIKLAMIETHKAFDGSGVNMLIQVHDELVFEVPDKDIEEVARQVKTFMEGVIDLKVPLVVDMEKGPNWFDMKEIEV
ncbi:MAG: DNA polymerase I [Candidatus Omnitrophica bacterium]|nr:DNA polymerase I [Candidatus Omnitrophota bacterium]